MAELVYDVERKIYAPDLTKKENLRIPGRIVREKVELWLCNTLEADKEEISIRLMESSGIVTKKIICRKSSRGGDKVKPLTGEELKWSSKREGMNAVVHGVNERVEMEARSEVAMCCLRRRC